MQIDDRREEWMGLGIILAEVRFRTWVEKRPDSRWGHRVRNRVTWRSLFKTGTMVQMKSVETYLNQFTLPLKEKYDTGLEVMQWCTLIEKQKCADAITDREGLHMMKWVTDNPIPPKSADYADFLNWIEAFDNEEEMAKETFAL
jgi:hypothetical protein